MPSEECPSPSVAKCDTRPEYENSNREIKHQPIITHLQTLLDYERETISTEAQMSSPVTIISQVNRAPEKTRTRKVRAPPPKWEDYKTKETCLHQNLPLPASKTMGAGTGQLRQVDKFRTPGDAEVSRTRIRTGTFKVNLKDRRQNSILKNSPACFTKIFGEGDSFLQQLTVATVHIPEGPAIAPVPTIPAAPRPLTIVTAQQEDMHESENREGGGQNQNEQSQRQEQERPRPISRKRPSAGDQHEGEAKRARESLLPTTRRNSAPQMTTRAVAASGSESTTQPMNTETPSPFALGTPGTPIRNQNPRLGDLKLERNPFDKFFNDRTSRKDGDENTGGL
ncbi:hypothetical protein BKA65DRAFT_543904 [Rhexocercosporidium sp. MPI-PUGE-AT-0058]|nr:hypothetical protein BKA65DRAFT_543904 [Rhexocercosporidium sp. MPI-PUGE-AT-0058]